MISLARLFAFLVSALIVGMAGAQNPVAWSAYGPGFYKSQVTLDASGNIYWVGVDLAGGACLLHAVKYSPSGTLLGQGSTSMSVAGVPELLPPVIRSNRIVVAFEGTSSLVVAFNLSDMSRAWWKELPNTRLGGLHASGSQVVTIEDVGTTTNVHRRNLSNGNIAMTTIVSSLSTVHQTTIDSLGNVYVAGTPDGTTSRLVRVNSGGSIAYDKAVNFFGYGDRHATAIATNESTQQVLIGYYAVVSGQAASNGLLFRADMSDGTGSIWSFNASDDDTITAILPQADGGVVLSLRFWDLSETYGTRIVRRNSTGVLWTVDHTITSSMEITLDQDSLGNIVVARGAYDAQNGFSTVVEKRSLSDGAVLWEQDQVGVWTGDLGVSSTGSPLHAGQNTLHAYWGLAAAFSRTTVIGGLPVTLQVQLSRPTPAANLPLTLLSNAAELPVPASVPLPLGATTTDVPIATLGVTATKSATVNMRYAGFIAQRSVTLLPPILSTLTVTPIQVTGGTPMQGTVTVVGTAPTGGWSINLASNQGAATVPATVVIAATETSAQFSVATSAVPANTGVVITASRNGVSRTVFVAVNAPALTTFTLGGASVQGGSNGSLTVNLNANAPAGGFSISLISGAPALVILPSSTSVPAGAVTRNLSFATAPVSATINVTLIAYRGSVVRTQTLTLTP